MTNAIELRAVSKRFGDHVAVHDLTLDVPQGSIYGFIGPNGSGKTTTIRMIMSIILPDTGTIRVLGEQSSASAWSSRSPFPPQSPMRCSSPAASRSRSRSRS